jgi:hypothetical protein
VHRLDDASHDCPATLRGIRGAIGQRARLQGVFRVVMNRARQFFHTRGSFLERRGLFFGPLREVEVACRYLLRGCGNRVGRIFNRGPA